MAQRVAWLLRVNRVLGPNSEFSRLSAFAAAFQGGCYASGVSESTVSRWETASARVTYLTIRRYEELLNIQSGQLVSIADTIYRHSSPRLDGAPRLARGISSDLRPESRLEALVDRALSLEEMSGWQWDELTGQLFAIPSVVIVPGRVWGELAGRLLEETIVADGVSWMQRFEAFNRMLGHPGAQVSAIAAVVDLIGDPANQVFVEPMSVLDASAHPDAGRFVLEQLVHPLNERARYGALLACVRKLRFGHFSPDQVAALVPIVIELLRDPGAHSDAAALAAELLRRMPASVRAGADAELRRALAADRTVHEVLAAGRLASPGTSGVVAERIVTLAATELRHETAFADATLMTLVDEMLFSPVLDTRLYASMLIYATPYAPPVAAAVAAELVKPRVVEDIVLASSLLGALRVIGGDRQRRLVERLVLSPGLPAAVAVAAVGSLGHVGGTSTDEFWSTALALYGRRWRRHREQQSAEALRGLVYALGIARNLKLLARVRNDEEAPGNVRAAAAWWLNLPPRFFANSAANTH